MFKIDTNRTPCYRFSRNFCNSISRKKIMTKPIPEGFHSITPALAFKDTRKAIDFYKKAFGAKERHILPGPDGKGVMYAEIKIGNSILMMGDEAPQQGSNSAETLGASPIAFYLYVDDVDAFFKKAVEAGSIAEMPPQEMFWGDRAGAVKDPFGYRWTFAMHTRDMSPEEMKKAADQAFSKSSKK